MHSLLKLLPFLRPYRRKIVGGSLIALANNAIGVLAPWVLKLAVDDLEHGVSVERLAEYAALIVLIALSAGILRYFMRVILIGMSRRVELDLRNAVFGHLQSLSASFYNRHRTGDLMARMTSDLESVRNVLGPGIMYPIDTVSMAIFSIALMLMISPRLTLFVLLAAPIVSLTVFYLGRITYKLHMLIQEQFARISDRVEENLSGVRVVRAFAQEEHEIVKFDAVNREYVNRNLAMTRVQALFMPVMFLLFEIGTALILLLGGRGIIRGELTLGDFVAFVGYLGMLAWPIIAVGWVANLFQRGAASMKRLNALLDAEPEVAQPATPRVPENVQGAIVFENVRFRYDDHNAALRNINFRIEAGQTVAFVGRTGSGKTTLVSLIPRLFDPTEGAVLIDGIPTTEWNLEVLRSQIGMVPQDALLFSDTLRHNIEFGVGNADDHRFSAVTDISQIEKDVQDFRNGYDTLVGERGLTLSGGQKGRASLARALVRDPKILILDDALAAVDTHTEEDILQGLKRFMEHRTSIIISHRVSTVRQADMIFVIDDGEIIEQGSHAKLVAMGGYYADLERLQRLEAELDAMESPEGDDE
jgi:ATP-binding cassette subfamily B multidrug efflux pump